MSKAPRPVKVYEDIAPGEVAFVGEYHSIYAASVDLGLARGTINAYLQYLVAWCKAPDGARYHIEVDQSNARVRSMIAHVASKLSVKSLSRASQEELEALHTIVTRPT